MIQHVCDLIFVTWKAICKKVRKYIDGSASENGLTSKNDRSSLSPSDGSGGCVATVAR